ncbi:MAG: Y-family DNA polymerase [SAR202 cluster bacterium]|nr:Y-family DNA polymerase [SAR202 cluster bacterium]|tara:strand:- start:4769 stop:6028 length:1260 start_codon:yes stop_codon:yes gene_type:complete
MKKFILADCNNFYVSCERVFNPLLDKKPVVVLSNNDGCIVSRSDEAKKLGIPMGAPLYQQKDVIEKNKVSVFSSNYQFYGDMSDRVMESLEMLTPKLEIYSIDEAFIKTDSVSFGDVFKDVINIRKKIIKWTGIPMSFGIAPTKTLSKIANHIAKKRTSEGVFDISENSVADDIMKKLPVEELWGISNKWGERLRHMGISTALQLKNSDAKFIRRHTSVVLERMIYELRGISCLNIESIKPKKNIMSSKSFGAPIGDIEPILEALSSYTARACEKLRKQNSKAGGIYVFIRTNPFQQKKPQHKNGYALNFDLPTSDTRSILHEARKLMRGLYKKGYKYHKCGIILLDLVPDSYKQTHFFSTNDSDEQNNFMKIVDRINNSMGPQTLFYLSQGIEKEWKMRSKNRSNRYTTKWSELLEVN